MHDFRKLLSAKTRKANDAVRDRILAFQDMDKADMAAELLSASRTLIDSGLYDITGRSYMNWSNEEWAIYRNIPALAVCLDPKIELRAEEIEDPEALARARDGDYRETLSSLELTVCHKLFTETLGGPEDVKLAANFLHDPRGQWSALEIAADTVSPGTYPGRIVSSPKAPLTGYQLIATHGDHDRVEKYAENVEDLEDLYRVTVAKRQLEDLSEDDKRVLRQLQSWPERLDFDALSIQSVDGDILQQWEIVAQNEAEISDPSF